MKKGILTVLVLLTVLFTACGHIDRKKDSQYQIFFLNQTETGLVSERLDTNATTPEALVEEFVKALDAAPLDMGKKKVKPDFLTINDTLLTPDGVLTLYFSKDYYEIDEIHEILMRAAIVKMFCQIDVVEYVEFYVGESPLALNGDIPNGLMSAADFVDNTGDASQYVKVATCTVYFASADKKTLESLILRVEYTGSKTMEQLVLEQLIAGTREETGLYRTVSDSLVVNHITTKDGICYIDLNAELFNLPQGISEELCVYSVVNSLTAMTSVSKVQITIDGETKTGFGSVDLSTLLERKLELIKE